MNTSVYIKSSRNFTVFLFVLLQLFFSSLTIAQTLNSVSPTMQRVHDYIELVGADFGTNQANSQVVFTDGIQTWNSGRAYLWRDNYIKIRVPVGKLDGASIVPISKNNLQVYVQTSSGVSGSLSFQVITANSGAMSFREMTSIASDEDVSAVLGAPNLNSARTKDAEVADVNNDGFPDINDNNSNNIDNNGHSVLRLNNQDKTFTAIPLEPLDATDSGTFATEISAGGDFFENHTSYDADYADINNDRLPDLLQTAANNAGGSSAHRIRLLINNHGGVAGQFSEETSARMPSPAFGTTGCPDDIDHGDIDGDGDIDFLVTMRTAPGFCSGTTSEIRVFVNTGSGNFASPVVVNARTGNSTHDAFWIDANQDGLLDFVAANEWDMDTGDSVDLRSELFLNDGAGGFNLNRTFSNSSTSGAEADFNGDGLMDFVLGRTTIKVYFTLPTSACFSNPASDCQYTELEILADDGANNPFYDLEVGDINADGFPDIIGARIGSTINNIPIWLNNGDGTFTEITGGNSSTILPGHNGDYQRLSADLLDLDLDGDLDLYVTGQDSQDNAPSGSGFGRGPNQLFENLLFGLTIVSPTSGHSAYAGSATGGRKVLIRLRSDSPIASLDPDEFVITVDGTPLAADALVTGAQIEEEYWLLVQMPAKANGCYDLQVSVASDVALQDLETGALCYDDERLFDRALVIDRTTSMLYNSVTDEFNTEKMDAAKASANFFVNLTENSDQIAVTSFKHNSDDGDGVIEQNEMARTDWPMSAGFDTTTMTDNRPLAIGVVNGINPDGTYFPYQTTIGAGLKEAWTELQTEGTADHEWEIVLLSDGIENLAPFWEEIEAGPPIIQPIKPEITSASPSVKVHTIAIGQDADSQVLMDIANSTGGEFFNLYEGTGSFGLISRLASVYKYIDEESRDEQRFFYREGVPEFSSPPNNGTSTHVPKRVRIASFYVPTDFESITVGFHWNRNNAMEQIQLYDPDMALITEITPTRTIHSNPMHRVYRIRDPKPGWHHYIVHLATNEPFEFYAVASGITNVMFKGRKGNVTELSPGTFSIPLWMIGGDFDPILNANVSGEVVLPDKTRIPIALFDNGSNKDGRNHDGIYGREFVYNVPGTYSVELTTTGLSNRNEPFTRYTIMSFVFPGHEPDAERPEKPPGHDGIKCPSCQFLWTILIVFGLLLMWLIWQWYRCCYRRDSGVVSSIK